MSEQQPTRNVELLERTMQHIDDHPELHDQADWANSCGTAACFAGWSALLAFGTSVLDGYGFELPAPFNDRLPNGNHPRMSIQAARLLGLTKAEAETLFDANNTRDMLRLMVKDLANGDDLRELDEYENEAGA
ncbi:MAG: hypothetical protein WBB07_17425 [Mycobacterium sp.]